MIEGKLVAVSDGSGRYTIANLRPGTYTITFSLEGFNRLVREGVALSGESTIQVNVQMTVGALEQSITVTGESPLVDVQTVREQFAVTREMMDTLPGASTFAGRALLIPGVRNTGMGEGQYWPAAHGNTWRDAQTANDGMRANVLIDDGQWQMGWEMNQAATAELAYDAGGAPAEVQTGGVLQNAIPKEGGNTFAGTLHMGINHEKFASSNQDAELERVLGEVNRQNYNYNVNPGYGGPILRDKLWFYGSFLRRDTKTWAAGSQFTGLLGTPEQREKNDFPAGGEQGFNRNWANAGLLRITNQLSERHKWRLSFDRVNNTQPLQDVTRLTPPEHADRIPQPTGYHTQARYTATLTNRLLLEAGFALQYNKWRREQFEWNESSSSYLDALSGAWNGAYWITGNQPEYQRTMNASLSYVTGSHNFKAGFQNRWGYFNLYNGPHPGDIRSHITFGGFPILVSVLSTPLGNFKAEINHDIGLFAQDTWTLGKWTLNLGVRGDFFKNGNPAQQAEAGSFVGARDFPALPAANWNTVVPRIGVAYDLFGNGKTALKAYAHKYVNQEATTLALAVNPMASYTWGARQENRAWSDVDRNGSALNADNTVQWTPGCTYPSRGCEIGPSPNAKFGTLEDAARFDVNDRPGQWEYSVGVQHELFPGLSVGMAYYRRDYYNFWRDDNILQGAGDYIPFTWTAPVDERLGEYSGFTHTLYNLNPAVDGLSERVLVNVTEQDRVYNGLEWTAQGRFGRGGFFGASVNYERTFENTCSQENLNLTVFCDSPRAWQTQYKGHLAYPIPKVDILASVFVQGYPGPNIDANYTVTAANAFATSGVVLTGGRSLPAFDLLPPEVYFLPYQNKVDLRFMRRFTVAGTRIAPTVDLFNVLNENTTTGVNATCCAQGRTDATGRYIPGFRDITSIMQARYLRFGIEIDW
jgi:hypothetical protein